MDGLLKMRYHHQQKLQRIGTVLLFLTMLSFSPLHAQIALNEHHVDADSISSVQQSSQQFLSLSTNLITDAVLAPCIGAELRIGKQLSLAAHAATNWFAASPLYNHARFATADVETRYWIATQPKDVMRRGQHLGLYIGLYRYDFYFSHKGDQANLNWGIGASYGYTLSLNKKLSLDFTIGLGYVGGKYKSYEYIDDAYEHYVWTADKKRHYVGPSKAEVSLIWHLF